MRLERLRDDVRNELGQRNTTSVIDDAAIDHALANGLIELGPHYPSVIESLTIATAGYIQNIKALAPTVLKLESVQYPYDAANPNAPSYAYRIPNSSTAIFVDIEPQIGDTILAKYKARHTILDLRGSTTNTLPEDDEYEHPLIIAAVGHILYLESMRMLSSGASKEQLAAAKQLQAMAEDMAEQAIDETGTLSTSGQNPAWSEIGLCL